MFQVVPRWLLVATSVLLIPFVAIATLPFVIQPSSSPGPPAASRPTPTVSASPTIIAAVPADAAHAGTAGTAQPGRTIVVKDANKDPLPKNAQQAAAVKRGAQIFNDTATYAKEYSPNSALTCASCHINGGQQMGALPLTGVGPQFPEYNTRSNRMFTLTDRILDCFARSVNGKRPAPESSEAVAVATYLMWISDGQPAGTNPPWRGQNKIADQNLIPIPKLDPQRGQQMYEQKYALCHQANGQGSGQGPSAVPPLWGDKSFNDGAGLARLYTFAGFIRYAMPLNAPGTLNDEEAQQIAAYVLSHDRPAYPTKDQDYVGVKMPVDAVYYPQQYPQNPLKR